MRPPAKTQSSTQNVCTWAFPAGFGCWREEGVAYLTVSPCPLAQGLAPNWEWIQISWKDTWMNDQPTNEKRLGASWLQRWENVAFWVHSTLFVDWPQCSLKTHDSSASQTPVPAMASCDPVVTWQAFSIPASEPAQRDTNLTRIVLTSLPLLRSPFLRSTLPCLPHCTGSPFQQ